MYDNFLQSLGLPPELQQFLDDRSGQEMQAAGAGAPLPPPPEITAPPANIMQAAAAPMEMPQPAPVAQAPQPAAAPTAAPRQRRSLLDIVGRAADVLARVGGADALYQPTLDAYEDRANMRDDRGRMIDLEGMKKTLTQQQITEGGGKIEDTARARLAQALGGIAGRPDAAALWPQVAQEAGVDPQKAAAIGQIIERNPDAAGIFAKSLGWAPEKQGSTSGAVQNFEAYQEILKTQGPEAAQRFLSLAQPSSEIQPYQRAQLAFDERKAARDDRRLDIEEERRLNPPPTAAERRQIRQLQISMPKLSSSFRASTRDIDTQIRDATRLRGHPGLAGITGAIQGRIPLSILPQSNAAQALLDTMLARGTFAELQEMRNNSPTGGALGSVSDAEGKRLQAAVGQLSQAQNQKDFQAALDNYIAELKFSKSNLSTSFDESKDLVSSLTSEQPRQPSAPARSSGGGSQSGGGKIISVTSPAEAAKLPKGTRFRTSDGQIRIRN